LRLRINRSRRPRGSGPPVDRDAVSAKLMDHLLFRHEAPRNEMIVMTPSNAAPAAHLAA